jgi:aminoglycoside phosphotransferase (APT) family kinase protein
MPLPSKRDPERLARTLEPWFAARLGAPCRITDVAIPEGTGMSSETLLFTVHHGDRSDAVVTRLRPDMSDWPVFPIYDLAAQAGAMRLVARYTSVPVPNVRFVEDDESLLGSPFLVMDRVGGRALPDMPPYVFGGSFLDEFSVDQQRDLARTVASLQAQIHAIDLDRARRDGVDLSFLPPSGGDDIARLLAEQRAYYDWARGDLRLPIIERALEWLATHAPKNPGPTVLNWGDARPGNVMFDGLVPTAVLDWEMVNAGPAGVDVGWLVFMHQFFQSLADVFQLPGFPEFCRADDVQQAYVAAGGREIDDFDWYVVYGSLRFAAIAIRTSLREAAYGNREMPDDPEDLIMHKAMLYEQIGA